MTDAVFTMLPASRSAALVRCTPVHVVVAPGARVESAHDKPTTLGSLSVTAVRVTLPVLVTTKV